MALKEREFRPSPSGMGECKRMLVMWGLNYPQFKDPKAELRALRGKATHTIFPEILAYVVEHDPLFSQYASVRVMDHELEVDIDFGHMKTGTIDAVLECIKPNGDMDLIVTDLKSYARLPEEPYESNILQLQVYMEAFGGDSPGILVYFDMHNNARCFLVERNPNIEDVAKAHWSEVLESIESRTMPSRLDWGNPKCNYCSYKESCWGSLWDELAAMVPDTTSPPPYAAELSMPFAEVVGRLEKARREKSAQFKIEEEAKSMILNYMTKFGITEVRVSESTKLQLDPKLALRFVNLKPQKEGENG